jgi:hypothetical protein
LGGSGFVGGASGDLATRVPLAFNALIDATVIVRFASRPL